MPTYDYLCPACGAREERLTAIKWAETQRCERCGARLVIVIARVPLSAGRSTEGKGRST